MRAKLLEQAYWYTGWIYDFSKLATMLLIFVLVVNYFIISAIIVRGQSMYPSYKDGDIILVDKISYHFRQPKRGDVVALYFPGETEKRLFKRVIALPGETVLFENGRVYINGSAIDESYLLVKTDNNPKGIIRINKDEYFVMGDNRQYSSDSRSWGTVPKDYLVGRAISKVAPL